MKRMERIFQFVKRETESYTQQDLSLGKGVTTQDVAEALGIQRTNASKDLNELVKMGRLGKIEGRPVKYVLLAILRHRALEGNVRSYKEMPKRKDTGISPASSKEDIFKKVIGASGSMRVPVEQAKAAILYPPKGLNSLITGGTGTGKTYFANVMFAFAKQNGLVGKDKELITFNCADYAHNGELLMSHLFGYVAGSFTGANKTKEGLIKAADGSILFLDEIHRLPPEGQEMIFYFMDHGVYSRLGENTKSQKANVRIICATTEDPASALLQTFVRRIPIHIHLPSFSQRKAKEKVDLVKVMIGLEAQRIQRGIAVTEDVVRALIGSVNYGNVGQLKSNIQLLCAQAFLKQMDKEEIALTTEELPDSIKKGLLQISAHRHESGELSQWLEPMVVIQPNQDVLVLASDAYELPYNLYDIIGDKAAVLTADGIDQETINHYITTDINVHLKSFYKNQGFSFGNDHRLAEIVDQKVIEVTKEIYDMANHAFDHAYQHNFIYAMSLHISSSIKRIRAGKDNSQKSNESIRKMVLEYPKEYQFALSVKKYLSEALVLELPDDEVDFLTVLLVSLKKAPPRGKIGIIVAAHGNTTATSMVQVVQGLLGADHLRAVDMPLDMHPRKALEQITETVRAADAGSGVLLLVDMGSLWTFGAEAEKITGVPVKTIDMVTTPMVLEAARKTQLMEGNLESLYESLRDFRGYGNAFSGDHKNSERKGLAAEVRDIRPKAIVAVCASGEGSAVKMLELIESFLDEDMMLDYEVFPISVVDMEQSLLEIQADYAVQVVVGIKNPLINCPYISLSDLLSESGKETLLAILNEGQKEVPSSPPLVQQQAQKMCFDYIVESNTFLNPHKTFAEIWDFAAGLTEAAGVVDDHFACTINLALHTAGAMERVLLNQRLSAEGDALAQAQEDKLFQITETYLTPIEETFALVFGEVEVYYMMKIVENALI